MNSRFKRDGRYCPCMNWGKITNDNHINRTIMLHYLVEINAGIYVPRNILFDYFAMQNTSGGECSTAQYHYC